MRYGPLSPFDIHRLTEILDAKRVDYTISSSVDDVEAIDEHRKAVARPGPYTGTEGTLSYLYIDLPEVSVPLIQFELEKMGLGFTSTGDELGGYDPEFEKLVSKQHESSSRSGNYFAFGLIALVVGALYYWRSHP